MIIATTAGDVLLLKRADRADCWQSVTGSLHWNETAFQAAYRELHEETGLVAAEGLEDCARRYRFWIAAGWRYRFHPDVRENTEHTFRLILEARTQITLNPDEHTEYVWLPRGAAMDKVTFSSNRDAIQTLIPPG